jgi:hypothetical protein
MRARLTTLKHFDEIMASSLDGLNTLRNQASAAHSNGELLDDVGGVLARFRSASVINSEHKNGFT